MTFVEGYVKRLWDPVELFGTGIEMICKGINKPLFVSGQTNKKK